MLELTILTITAIVVVAIWVRWGAELKSLVNSMLETSATRDGYQELLREAEWRDLEGETLLQETLQSDDELARQYLAALEAREKAV